MSAVAGACRTLQWKARRRGVFKGYRLWVIGYRLGVFGTVGEDGVAAPERPNNNSEQKWYACLVHFAVTFSKICEI